MFKKRERLSRSEFTTLLTKGVRLHGSLMTLVLLPGEKDLDTKYGVVVGKKIAKNASLRHLVRRRVYDAFRALGPLDMRSIACLTKPAIVRSEYQAIHAELQQLTARYKRL